MKSSIKWFDYQVIWHYHLIISDGDIWKRLQNVYSQIKQTPTHRRLLAFPVCPFIIGEDSFVITSRQFGIHSFLQSVFQCLVHSDFLESIMLFSICCKDSIYPSSRFRSTMELSPHPNDIRLRPVHMSVSWHLVIPIVKYVFLTEVVIRDVHNWFFQKPPLNRINLYLRWCDSDFCLVRLIGKTNLFRLPRPLSLQPQEILKFLVHTSRNWCKPQLRLYFRLYNTENVSLHVI